ncbi:MAG: hypothetical protein WDZ31_12290 [Phycisphaeraceae bacterium]
MNERYPDDASLLALTQDETTGVPYIPTGASPYHLLFRRMLHRLLRASERANDLRVYQDGDLSVGVRPGRCFVADQAVTFEGAQAITLDASATTWLWLDDQGDVQTSDAGLPANRGTFIPLARVDTGAATIESVTDLRGEAMLASVSAGALGITATADEINQALDGIDATVTAMALNFLCDGPSSTADALHRHLQTYQSVDGEAAFRIINASSSEQASVALRLSLPSHTAGDTRLELDADTGWLRQRQATGPSYYLLGTVHEQYRHAGTLAASATGRLLGVAPIAGEVIDVVLSVGDNLQTDDNDDNLRARVKVNGVDLCTSDPTITVADGAGFRSTAQGAGDSAVLKDDGTQMVACGDLLTLDLLRTADGSVSAEASDVVVLLVIRALGPT